jgi:hypothetical protein
MPPPPPYAAQNPPTTNRWIGRTREQINEDNRAIAEATHANEYRALVPENTNNRMNFWCREKDGTWTLRDPLTIKEALQPGYWATATNNRICFIRT